MYTSYFTANTLLKIFLTLALVCIGITIFLQKEAFEPNTQDNRPIIKHVLTEKWVGDFDSMVKRKKIRVLVSLDKMMFFFDGPRMRGATVDGFAEFKNYINKKLKNKDIKIQIIFIPMSRDNLIPALINGYGDIAAANLTITEDRLKLVDFTDPFIKNVKEVLITGPNSKINSINDLSGQIIHVRSSSSYYENLNKLNKLFKIQKKKKIKIIKADEYLEDSDLLEMVNANMIPATIVDSHKAYFWEKIFQNINIHYDIAINTDGKIAWAMRKDSVKLKTIVNEFVKTHKVGTLPGNIIFKRYLEENKWALESLGDEHLERLDSEIQLFQKYAKKYNFDWLILAALAYQESRLDQSKRSSTGAVGIMQILPSTADDKNVNIKNIDKIENNIHAGTKYLRFLKDRYFSDESITPINRDLLALAAYNAGPAKVAKLRKEASEAGLDPNIWFGEVELIAAKRIGRETVQYVSNIYKYYIAYRLSFNQTQAKFNNKS